MSLSLFHATKASIYIMTDKRALNALNNNSKCNDNEVKVLNVRPGVYFQGGTVVSMNMHFNELLKQNRDVPARQLIKLVETFDRRINWPTAHIEKSGIPSTVSMHLAGIDEVDNRIFVWHGDYDGTNKLIYLDDYPEGASYTVVSSFHSDVRERIYNLFVERKRLGIDTMVILEECAKLAHELDSITLSKEMDFWHYQKEDEYNGFYKIDDNAVFKYPPNSSCTVL